MPIRDTSGPPPGTRDLLEADLVALWHVQHQLQDLLRSYSYRTVDVPVLEHTDLYLRKLGSQVAAHMFTFTDQRGDHLCLRPEFTGSVIRSYIQHAEKLSLPVRWQYCGPVFRDQETPPRQLRQFTQLGAELIGPASPRADAELIALACKGLQALRLSQTRAVVGHAGLLHKLLSSFQLSERVIMHIASNLEMLREGPEGVTKLREGLEELRVLPAGNTSVSNTLSKATETEEAASLVQWLLGEGTTRPTGRRTPEEILQRFQAKLRGADNPAHLEQAIALAADLAAVRAAPKQAVAEGRRIIESYHLDLGILGELEQVVDLLTAQDLGDATVEVDLGLTRVLGYYTGIVFELFIETEAPPRPVGGGGRYDGLVRALGGQEDVAALGFAYTLESLVESLPDSRLNASTTPVRSVLVVPERDSDFPEAMRYAEVVRAQGGHAALEVMAWSAEERSRYCRTLDIDRIVVVSAGRTSETPVEKEEAPYAPAGTP